MSEKYLDISGNRYGRWTVVERSTTKVGSERHWICICDCGTEGLVGAYSLKSGRSTSCGCFQKELAASQIKERSLTHGKTGTREYRIWNLMKDRCNHPGRDNEEFYFAKGISYPDKWERFEGFWEDMGEGYADNLEIDRINPDADYSKENCRWVDVYTSRYNRKVFKNNTSGRTGVLSENDKWRATIQVKGARINLGLFTTFEEACEARTKAEIEYFGFSKE